MLELQNVSFGVAMDAEQARKEILHDINLKVEDNGFIVITGPNGGGKSTLAKLIMGIEKPTAGKILFNGADITGLSVTERARLGIGFAFQQPVRFKGLYVRDLLRLAAGRTLATDEACAYLAEVGLCAMDYIDREIDARLSGGELKRIEIATLIARAPQLYLFDEPEAGIDLWSFAKLTETFRLLQSKGKNTILVISHQERIIDLADEIVMLSNGQIARHGTKEEIMPNILADTGGVCSFLQPGGNNCRQSKEG